MKAGTHLSEEFGANFNVHQGTVLSPLLFAIVIDVVTNELKECTLLEILCADDLLFMSGTNGETEEKKFGFKRALESKGL